MHTRQALYHWAVSLAQPSTSKLYTSVLSSTSQILSFSRGLFCIGVNLHHYKSIVSILIELSKPCYSLAISDQPCIPPSNYFQPSISNKRHCCCSFSGDPSEQSWLPGFPASALPARSPLLRFTSSHVSVVSVVEGPPPFTSAFYPVLHCFPTVSRLSSLVLFSLLLPAVNALFIG